MGSVYKRPDSPFWWLKFRDAAGALKQKKTTFRKDDPAGEKEARAALEIIERRIRAQQREAGGEKIVTVRSFATGWVEKLRRRGVKTAFQYEQRFRDFVFPTFGDLELTEVTSQHIRDWLLERLPVVTTSERMRRHLFTALSQMFEEALVRELVARNPCKGVPRHERPKKRDKNPLWRGTAVYARREVEQLISAEQLHQQHLVLWSVLLLTGMRIGEALALRWERYDTETPVLGRLTVATSYDTRIDLEGPTKTKRPRDVPVHPTLAKVLAGWRLGGWEGFLGRAPRPGDLIIPDASGAFWSATSSLLRLHEDLVVLGLRKRGQHDMRRTFISLARADGASKDVLRWVTHGPEGDIVDDYTVMPWEARCAAVAALRIDVLEGKLVALPRAVGSEAATVQLRSGQPPEIAAGFDGRRGTRTLTGDRPRATQVAVPVADAHAHGVAGDGQSRGHRSSLDTVDPLDADPRSPVARAIAQGMRVTVGGKRVAPGRGRS